MHCTTCDSYFCEEDFKVHREEILSQMNKIIEERNRLQKMINSDQNNPIFEQIDKWNKNTIAKVNQVAADVRRQTIELLNSKNAKISKEFEKFSEDLFQLQESENYVERDLERLDQVIDQFKEDLKQSNRRIKIILHTERSDKIDWKDLICVEEIQSSDDTEQEGAIAGKNIDTIYKIDTLFEFSSETILRYQNKNIRQWRIATKVMHVVFQIIGSLKASRNILVLLLLTKLL